MTIMAQAAEAGTDLAKILGIGAPSGIAVSLLVYLTKLWLESREGKRKDKCTERESESGIVETTSALTKLVREQMLEMASEIKALKLQNEELQRQAAATKAEHATEIGKLNDRITGLEIDNEQLRCGRWAPEPGSSG